MGVLSTHVLTHRLLVKALHAATAVPQSRPNGLCASPYVVRKDELAIGKAHGREAPHARARVVDTACIDVE